MVMTKEEKQLLLVDLCARLPYGVICTDNRHGDSRVTYIDITPDDIEQKNGKVVVYYFDFDECGELENCKPYLRPMSSMTEEEKRVYLLFSLSRCNEKCLDWLNAHHFDYRGLIPMGLALKALEGMYNLEK